MKKILKYLLLLLPFLSEAQNFAIPTVTDLATARRNVTKGNTSNYVLVMYQDTLRLLGATTIFNMGYSNPLIRGSITSTDITITGGTNSIIGSGVTLTLSSLGRNRHFVGSGNITNTVSAGANIGDIYFNTDDGTVYQKSNLSFPSGLTYITLPSGTWVKLGDFTLNKSKVGLGNVDNTSDLNKPISTATQAALNGKENTLTKGNITSSDITITGGTGAIIGAGVSLSLSSTGRARLLYGTVDVTNTVSATANFGDLYINTTSKAVYQKTNLSFPSGLTYITTTDATWVKLGNYSLTKSDVGLGNVDNTSDLNKPISTATQTALDLKANLASPTFTGTVTIPSPFTLGATSVTSTGTQLNYLSGATGTTGTGNLVYSNSPTLVTPNLGTPSAVTLTNGTGLPVSTGISGLGSGVATFLATPSSANLLAALTTKTGTGNAVFSDNATLTGTTNIATIANSNGANFATNSGNVGIGRSASAYKLELQGDFLQTSTGATKYIIGSSGTGGRNFSINSYPNGFFTNPSFTISDETAGATRFLIDNVGNIGIANTSPAQKLDVTGGIRATTGYLLDGTTNKTLSIETATNNRAFFGGWQDGAYMTSNRNPADGTFTQTGKAAAVISVTGTTSNSQIEFLTTTTNNALPTSRMLLDGNGNVLIGTTTNAGYKTDINGTLRATQYNLSALNTAPTSASATGITGEIRVTSTHIYVCTATNTWVRAALSTW